MASACTQNLNQTPVNSLVTIDSPLRNLNPQTAKKPGLVLIQLLKDTRSQMFRSFVTHQKFHYLLWSTTRLWSDTSCPSCGCNMQVSTLKRKWLVTRLIECSACGLRYRVPKLSQEQSDKFYQNDYSQGLTTEMPSVTELEQLKAANFKNTEKDYSKYLRTLSAAKIPVGANWLEEIKNARRGVSDQSARNQVYDDTMEHLPGGFTKDTLRKKTQRAVKIYKLF